MHQGWKHHSDAHVGFPLTRRAPSLCTRLHLPAVSLSPRRQGGLVTVLPLTGVTTLARLLVLPPGELPDFVVGSVANLAGME